MDRITMFDSGEVRGWLHWPERTPTSALALTHGAGSDCTAPLLVESARAFAATGIGVLRFDLPFRRARPSGPPHPGAASKDQAGVRAAAAALRGLVNGQVFIGGHSYGGRQASMLAAEEPEVAEGLLLLSYPLHPPKQPEKPRTTHFTKLSVPCVFLHGTKDPFATSAELETAAALIPARTRIVHLEGAGHDLKRGRFDFAEIIDAVLQSS